MRLRTIPALIRWFFVADLLLGVLYLLNWGAGQPYARINRLLDLDQEANLPTWYSSLQWATAGTLFILAAVRERSRASAASVPLALIGVAFLGLSMDEVAQLHEKFSVAVSTRMGFGQGTLRGLWLPALGIPAFAVIGLLARRASQVLFETPGAMRCLLVGMVIFAAGAFLVEPIAIPIIGQPGPFLVYLEETCEMVGVTLMLWCGFKLAWIPEVLDVYRRRSAEAGRAA